MTGRISLGAGAIPEPDREWLAAVERLPVDSVWHGGHVLPVRGSGGEVITRLAFLTAWTERVRVGSAIVLLPLYHPVVLAKQLADLDSTSGGRLAVGIGVGGEFPHEFDAIGVPLATRGRRADESIAVMCGGWSGERVSHDGEFFHLDDVELRPVRPAGAPDHRMQSGGPPIVVAGRKQAAAHRAARLGDGWMPYLMSARSYARSVQDVRDEARRIGRDLSDFEWMVSLKCCVRSDRETAQRDAASFLGYAYRDQPPEKMDHIAIVGTPDDAVARFQEYVDAGARTLIVSPATYDRTLDVVRLVATEVLPRADGPGLNARLPVTAAKTLERIHSFKK